MADRRRAPRWLAGLRGRAEAHRRAAEIIAWANELSDDQLLACASFAATFTPRRQLPTGAAAAARAAQAHRWTNAVVRLDLPAPQRKRLARWKESIAVSSRILRLRKPSPAGRPLVLAPHHTAQTLRMIGSLHDVLEDALLAIALDGDPRAAGLSRRYELLREFHQAWRTCTPAQRGAARTLMDGADPERVPRLITALAATDNV